MKVYTSLRSADKRVLIAWLVVTLFCALQSAISFRYNNYLIFKYVFVNLWHQRSLYAVYPDLYHDANHYGPLFGVFIMPWALLPDKLALILWDLFNHLILFLSIRSLRIKNDYKILWLMLPCVIASGLSEQFNPSTAAMIILSYALLNKQKGIWSAMLIVMGTFIKLYPVIGLAFFFFSKSKVRFIGYLCLWSVICIVLPMFLSSPAFVLNSYVEWFHSLQDKNAHNLMGPFIDISIMGFIRSLLDDFSLSNLIFLLPGVLIFFIPYLNRRAYSQKDFQLLILASALLFVVLFSTGSEDCTYIIAMPGAGILYCLFNDRLHVKLLVLLACFASFSLPAVCFSEYAAQHIVWARIIALPFTLVWLLVIFKAMRVKKDVTNTPELIAKPLL